jgi:urease accessory protein
MSTGLRRTHIRTRPCSRMEIAIAAREGRARVDLVESALVPRVIRLGPAAASVAIIAGSALLVDGDHVSCRVRVGAGCRLELEDVGGTVAYGSTGRRSSWTIHIEVAAGGSLVWHTMPFVAADASHVTRTTVIRLARGASALLRETLVLGRHGERGGTIRANSEVVDERGTLLREDIVLSGEAPRTGVLGSARVLDTAMSFGIRRNALPGALQLERPGTVVRAIGSETHAATVEFAWREWSGAHVTVA